MIMRMRAVSVSYEEIAESLGITRAEALAAMRRALAAAPSEVAAEQVALMLRRYDMLMKELLTIIGRFHPTVNNGRSIVNPDTGDVYEDDTQRLAAIKIATDLEKRTSALLGLDAPKTVMHMPSDAIEAEIRRLEAELSRNLGDDVTGDGGLRDRRPSRDRPAIEAPRDQDKPPGWR